MHSKRPGADMPGDVPSVKRRFIRSNRVPVLHEGEDDMDVDTDPSVDNNVLT
jgi:hypothetical protein